MKARFSLACRAGALFALALAAMSGARAAEEELSVGGVGGPNAVVWPHYVAEAKGLYAQAGFKIDLVYSQSNAVVLQALTAGSTKIAIAAGLGDPIHALQRGANIAVVRIDGQVGPYALMAKKEIKSIKDLKGHVASLDEAQGTTMVYFVIMLAKNGMTRKDLDFVYAGSTAARLAALESGAADAAMITAPQLFKAAGEGYVNLGYAPDYAPDVPFTAEVVNRPWAEANKDKVKRFIKAYGDAIRWIDDPKNKTEAIDILQKISHMDRGDIDKSYDLFKKINYFDKSDEVSVAKVEAFAKAFKEVDPSVSTDVSKLVMRIN